MENNNLLSVSMSPKIEDSQNKKDEFGINLEEMEKAGLAFGHSISKCHPKMKPYLQGVKNTVHLINLEKTAEGFKKALEFIKEIISQSKVLLLVGTKIQAKNLVKNIAEECNLPYVNERWLGGTLTNFEVMKRRIAYLRELEKNKQGGEFEKYSKKERIRINKEMMLLEKKFTGIKKMENLPEAIFVLDIKKDDLAIKEARMKKIKTIAIVDTNTDPSIIDYPIPANDDAISSLKYILEKVKETILKAQKEKEQEIKNRKQETEIKN